MKGKQLHGRSSGFSSSYLACSPVLYVICLTFYQVTHAPGPALVSREPPIPKMQQSASSVFRLAFGALAQRQQMSQQAIRLFGAAAEPLRKAGPVPDGHLNSDLSPTVCHIGLGRRRDLTLRQDLCLWQNDKKLSLTDVFKVGRRPACVACAHAPNPQHQFFASGAVLMCKSRCLHRY